MKQELEKDFDQSFSDGKSRNKMHSHEENNYEKNNYEKNNYEENGQGVPDSGNCLEEGEFTASGSGCFTQEKPEEEPALEEMLLQVENCIAQLENPRISLEDSFRYYEEGIRKLKICNDKVAQIEQKMLVLNQRGELENF